MSKASCPVATDMVDEMETASIEATANSDNLKVHNYARCLKNAFGALPNTPSKYPANKKLYSITTEYRASTFPIDTRLRTAS